MYAPPGVDTDSSGEETTPPPSPKSPSARPAFSFKSLFTSAPKNAGSKSKSKPSVKEVKKMTPVEAAEADETIKKRVRIFAGELDRWRSNKRIEGLTDNMGENVVHEVENDDEGEVKETLKTGDKDGREDANIAGGSKPGDRVTEDILTLLRQLVAEGHSQPLKTDRIDNSADHAQFQSLSNAVVQADSLETADKKPNKTSPSDLSAKEEALKLKPRKDSKLAAEPEQTKTGTHHSVNTDVSSPPNPSPEVSPQCDNSVPNPSPARAKKHHLNDTYYDSFTDDPSQQDRNTSHPKRAEQTSEQGPTQRRATEPRPAASSTPRSHPYTAPPYLPYPPFPYYHPLISPVPPYYPPPVSSPWPPWYPPPSSGFNSNSPSPPHSANIASPMTTNGLQELQSGSPLLSAPLPGHGGHPPNTYSTQPSLYPVYPHYSHLSPPPPHSGPNQHPLQSQQSAEPESEGQPPSVQISNDLVARAELEIPHLKTEGLVLRPGPVVKTPKEEESADVPSIHAVVVDPSELGNKKYSISENDQRDALQQSTRKQVNNGPARKVDREKASPVNKTSSKGIQRETEAAKLKLQSIDELETLVKEYKMRYSVAKKAYKENKDNEKEKELKGKVQRAGDRLKEATEDLDRAKRKLEGRPVCVDGGACNMSVRDRKDIMGEKDRRVDSGTEPTVKRDEYQRDDPASSKQAEMLSPKKKDDASALTSTSRSHNPASPPTKGFTAGLQPQLTTQGDDNIEPARAQLEHIVTKYKAKYDIARKALRPGLKYEEELERKEAVRRTEGKWREAVEALDKLSTSRIQRKDDQNDDGDTRTELVGGPGGDTAYLAWQYKVRSLGEKVHKTEDEPSKPSPDVDDVDKISSATTTKANDRNSSKNQKEQITTPPLTNSQQSDHNANLPISHSSSSAKTDRERINILKMKYTKLVREIKQGNLDEGPKKEMISKAKALKAEMDILRDGERSEATRNGSIRPPEERDAKDASRDAGKLTKDTSLVRKVNGKDQSPELRQDTTEDNDKEVKENPATIGNGKKSMQAAGDSAASIKKRQEMPTRSVVSDTDPHPQPVKTTTSDRTESTSDSPKKAPVDAQGTSEKALNTKARNKTSQSSSPEPAKVDRVQIKALQMRCDELMWESEDPELSSAERQIKRDLAQEIKEQVESACSRRVPSEEGKEELSVMKDSTAGVDPHPAAEFKSKDKEKENSEDCMDTITARKDLHKARVAYARLVRLAKEPNLTEEEKKERTVRARKAKTVVAQLMEQLDRASYISTKTPELLDVNKSGDEELTEAKKMYATLVKLAREEGLNDQERKKRKERALRAKRVVDELFRQADGLPKESTDTEPSERNRLSTQGAGELYVQNLPSQSEMSTRASPPPRSTISLESPTRVSTLPTSANDESLLSTSEPMLTRPSSPSTPLTQPRAPLRPKAKSASASEPPQETAASTPTWSRTLVSLASCIDVANTLLASLISSPTHNSLTSILAKLLTALLTQKDIMTVLVEIFSDNPEHITGLQEFERHLGVIKRYLEKVHLGNESMIRKEGSRDMATDVTGLEHAADHAVELFDSFSAETVVKYLLCLAEYLTPAMITIVLDAIREWRVNGLDIKLITRALMKMRTEIEVVRESKSPAKGRDKVENDRMVGMMGILDRLLSLFAHEHHSSPLENTDTKEAVLFPIASSQNPIDGNARLQAVPGTTPPASSVQTNDGRSVRPKQSSMRVEKAADAEHHRLSDTLRHVADKLHAKTSASPKQRAKIEVTESMQKGIDNSQRDKHIDEFQQSIPYSDTSSSRNQESSEHSRTRKSATEDPKRILRGTRPRPVLPIEEKERRLSIVEDQLSNSHSPINLPHVTQDFLDGNSSWKRSPSSVQRLRGEDTLVIPGRLGKAHEGNKTVRVYAEQHSHIEQKEDNSRKASTPTPIRVPRISSSPTDNDDSPLSSSSERTITRAPSPVYSSPSRYSQSSASISSDSTARSDQLAAILLAQADSGPLPVHRASEEEDVDERLYDREKKQDEPDDEEVRRAEKVLYEHPMSATPVRPDKSDGRKR